MQAPFFEGFAGAGPALALADAAAKATVVLALAIAVAAALRRSSAAVRHRLWVLTLGILALLPPLSATFPGWRLPILPGMTGGQDPSRVRLGEVAASEGVGEPLAKGPGPDRGLAVPELDAGGVPAGGDRPGSNPSPAGRTHGDLDAARRVVDWITLAWALGALAAAAPAVVGVLGGSLRRRQSRLVVDPSWSGLLGELARDLGIRRPVELRMCPGPVVPVTWGVLRPVVLLPDQAEDWDGPARRLVLMHELAHVRRGDVGFHLIGRLAAAAYWFHPLAWYALRRMRAECECACDDHVVRHGVRRTDYARRLVDLARSLRPAGPSTAVPMTRRDTLEERIMSILDDGRDHRPLGRRPARALFVGALALLAGLAAVRAGTSRDERAGDGPPPEPVPAAVDTPARQEPPATKPRGPAPGVESHPITVTGRAFDPDGNPIRGARVYLASLRAEYRRLAETATDAEGRYAFRDVPLPIERADTVTGRDHGSFQVFGQAEGFGFAWRPQKWFYPRPKPSNITYEPAHRDPPSRFEVGDEIELDLHFPPEAPLSGVVLDDRGAPLSGVRLEIRDCESLTIVDNVVPGWTLPALNERDSVPASMKIRTTGDDGQFAFTGLPVDCRFRIDVRAKGFPDRWVQAATTAGPQPDHDGSPVLTGDLALVLETSLDVPVRMTFGDTGEPAPRVAVQAGGGPIGILETTDERGLATLRLPPGEYRMQNWPARGTPYLVTEGNLVVGERPPDDPVEMSLRPAAILEVSVVDADTGAGIPDVDLWRRADPDDRRELVVIRSWEVATRIAWRDRPRTDARGSLRATIEPGTHRIGVALEAYPRGYEVVESQGQDVECRAGEVARLRFTMRKRR
jgi:beta-lactamase regulating signal transducer with metallopeptidase domain/protocatechuate 3,4-dioxygenase beta subunit